MNWFVLSLSATTILGLVLGVVVYLKNTNAQLNTSWAITCLAVSVWSLFILLSFIADSSSKALLFAKIANISASIIPIAFVSFCQKLTGEKSSITKIGGFLCFAFFVSAFTEHFMVVEPVPPFPYFPKARPVYVIFTLHFFSLAIYAEYLLFKGCRHHPLAADRNKLLYVLVGTSLGFISGATYFLPIFDLPMPLILPHFVWVYTVLVSYAIIKHGLLDIRIVISKGLVYSLLVAMISTIYFLLVYLASTYFTAAIRAGSLTSVLCISAIIAVLFKPLERALQSHADKILFGKSPASLRAENSLLKNQIEQADRFKAVATLAAGMAHEIKNPLTTIKTFTEYLPTKYDDPEFRANFHRLVTDEVERVNNIVRQLLEFSKPQEPVLTPVSLAPLLEETLELLNNNVLKLRIRVEKHFGHTSDVKADRTQMKQVFLNLLLNAIQSMPHGGSLSVITEDVEGGVIVRVKDTGCGITKEQLAHIFDPFYTTKDEGTGLGLSIVHGILEKHGGRVDVTSSPGAGTEFRVQLPS